MKRMAINISSNMKKSAFAAFAISMLLGFAAATPTWATTYSYNWSYGPNGYSYNWQAYNNGYYYATPPTQSYYNNYGWTSHGWKGHSHHTRHNHWSGGHQNHRGHHH